MKKKKLKRKIADLELKVESYHTTLIEMIAGNARNIEKLKTCHEKRFTRVHNRISHSYRMTSERIKNIGSLFTIPLPDWVKESIRINGIMNENISKLKKIVGEEKTKQLVNKFTNEAFAGKEVNHNYIIRKINEEIKNMEKTDMKKSLGL
jgi:hypothetical protein